MDRFTRGLIAGIAGGVLINIWSFFSYYILRFTNFRYLDWGAVMMYGHLPRNLAETLLAQLAQLMWSGFMGIILAFFIPVITSRGYLLKGAFWGFIAGFVMYATAILFRAPYFSKIAFGTAASQTIGGIIWGITTALVLKWLDMRIKFKVRD